MVPVDFMNVYLDDGSVYQGPCRNLRILLSSFVELGRQVGQDPLVAIYLDVQRFKGEHQHDWAVIEAATAEFGIGIFDVPAKNYQDQVDPVIIEHLLQVNEDAAPEIPVLLISADKGFIPVIEELRRTRNVYVGHPLNGNLSWIRNASDGWKWIHPCGWAALAVHDLFVGVTRDPGLVTPRYRETHTRMSFILSQLRPSERLRDWKELALMECQDDLVFSMTEEELYFYAMALRYYGVLQEDGDGYTVTLHELIGTPITLAS